MEYKSLRRFLTVVDYGSFTAAARAMGLTQQALSVAIAKLEEELDVPLFNRSRGGAAQLTAYGRLLVRHARSQVVGADRALADLRNLKDAHTGTVSVGIGEAFAAELVATAFRKFQELRPDVRLNVVEGYSMHLVERLMQGEFDFIAAGNSDFDSSHLLAKEPVYQVNDIVAARRDHPLARRKGLQLQDLRVYPWIVPYARSSDYDVILSTFDAHGVEPPSQIIRSDSISVGMHLLNAGDYLIMTTPSLLERQRQQILMGLCRLDTNKPTVARTASLIYMDERPMSPLARILLEQLRTACESWSAESLTSLAVATDAPLEKAASAV